MDATEPHLSPAPTSGSSQAHRGAPPRALGPRDRRRSHPAARSSAPRRRPAPSSASTSMASSSRAPSSEAALVAPVHGRLRGHLVLARTDRDFDSVERERVYAIARALSLFDPTSTDLLERLALPGRAGERSPRRRDPDLFPPHGRHENSACHRRRGSGPLVPSPAGRPPPQRLSGPRRGRRPDGHAHGTRHRARHPRRPATGGARAFGPSSPSTSRPGPWRHPIPRFAETVRTALSPTAASPPRPCGSRSPRTPS